MRRTLVQKRELRPLAPTKVVLFIRRDRKSCGCEIVEIANIHGVFMQVGESENIRG
jgi:hypothetical protein